ncbi:hypothetical protein BS47DRAFT_1385206 [Hydnum rufescens UP504]|uniref:Uncharacterized protein n=1 Tax=Hydnum rufescens UP504 TaxID=1448309 RepID=A0A9P6AK91_9AGAM|nr:hypothetical protein BS47DRAFT_1385206 [Hydnum rufescens UP504]
MDDRWPRRYGQHCGGLPPHTTHNQRDHNPPRSCVESAILFYSYSHFSPMAACMATTNVIPTTNPTPCTYNPIPTPANSKKDSILYLVLIPTLDCMFTYWYKSTLGACWQPDAVYKQDFSSSSMEWGHRNIIISFLETATPFRDSQYSVLRVGVMMEE